MHYETCAITGHRPSRFKWKYNENNNGCRRLKKRLREYGATSRVAGDFMSGAL